MHEKLLENEYLIKPEDMLFFRDARPMASGEGYGYGCNMPSPEHVHNAIRTALLDDLPSDKMEILSKNRSKSEPRKRKIGVKLFGSLKTVGPFPYHEKYGALFPVPKDVLKIKDHTIFLTKLGKYESGKRDENIWSPKFIPLSTIAAAKKKPEGFWTEKQMKAYLDGGNCDFTPVLINKIWRNEWRVGLKINPETNSSEEGHIFAASYMRLDEKAGFAFGVSLDEAEELGKLERIQIGGERRLAKLDKRDGLLPHFDFKKAEGDGQFMLKWILLTPAIFGHGAIPGWCVDSRKNIAESEKKVHGFVCLKNIEGTAELVACCTGDPKPISGWDLIEGGAKPTLYAVRPGAIYYFLCDSAESANSLAEKLHWKPRSDILGEKGFGLGVCSLLKPEKMGLC